MPRQAGCFVTLRDGISGCITRAWSGQPRPVTRWTPPYAERGLPLKRKPLGCTQRLMILKILGAICVLVATYFALVAMAFDRQMQAFRPEGSNPFRYAFVPIRWQKEFYTADGHEFVGRAWGASVKMFVFFLVGGVLLLAAY